MHTFSRFVRPYQRSCAAFSTVPVGNQIADYFSDIGTAYGHAMNTDHPILRAILSADGGYAEASRT